MYPFFSVFVARQTKTLLFGCTWTLPVPIRPYNQLQIQNLPVLYPAQPDRDLHFAGFGSRLISFGTRSIIRNKVCVLSSVLPVHRPVCSVSTPGQTDQLSNFRTSFHRALTSGQARAGIEQRQICRVHVFSSISLCSPAPSSSQGAELEMRPALGAPGAITSKGGHAARERIGLGLFTMDPDPAEKNHVESLFRVRDFTDVTLAPEGETKTRAHRMVLISASRKKIQQQVEQIISNVIQQIKLS